MTNYSGISRMNPKALEALLNQVYLTGMNMGALAAYAPADSGTQKALMDAFPFGMEWLKQDAEPAVADIFAEDGDTVMLEALVTVVEALAGIEDGG